MLLGVYAHCETVSQWRVRSRGHNTTEAYNNDYVTRGHAVHHMVA